MDETNINLSELKVDLPDNYDDVVCEQRSTEIEVEALDDESVEDDDSEYLEAVSSNEENNADDDDEVLLQVALIIDSIQLSKDTGRLPLNGHDYLRQVQLGRQKYPAVSYSKPPPTPSPWAELLNRV